MPHTNDSILASGAGDCQVCNIYSSCLLRNEILVKCYELTHISGKPSIISSQFRDCNSRNSQIVTVPERMQLGSCDFFCRFASTTPRRAKRCTFSRRTVHASRGSRWRTPIPTFFGPRGKTDSSCKCFLCS